MLNTTTITDATFAAAVLHARGRVLLLVTARDCEPCERMRPLVCRAAETTGVDVEVIELDTTDGPSAVRRLGISVVPTVLCFEGGRERGRLRGAQPLNALAALVRAG